MGASAHVGRVGGLAVALGVGVAVATGQGVASADTESSPSTSESTASAGANSASGKKSPDSRKPFASTRKPSASTRKPSESKKPSESRGASESTKPPDSNKPAESRGTSTAGDGNSTGANDLDESDTTRDESTEPLTEQRDNATRSDDSSEPEPAPRLRQRTTGKRATPTTSRVTTRSDQVTNHTVAVTTAPVTERTVNIASARAPEAETATGEVQLTSTTVNLPEPRTQKLTATVSAEPIASPQRVMQRALVSLFSSLGIGPSASNLPTGPVRSPIAMALLAFGARREYTQQIRALAKTLPTQPVAALTTSELAAAAATPTYPGTTRTPVTLSTNTSFIEFVTGEYQPGPGRYNLNYTISRFGIGGTDLGIMWDNGIKDNPATAVDEHQVLIAFGDTFSSASPVRTGVWRFNTLFRSPDDVLTNGLYVPNGVPYDVFSGSPMERPNWSDPILPSPGQPVHPPYAIGPEVTIIPTAGISTSYPNTYGARQYMSFMSIRSWDSPGRWTTNYSGVAFSDDNGQTWRIAPTSIRTAAVGRATERFVPGNQNFQQGAFLKPPAGSPEAEQGWVYSYGTPSGRVGTVYLSRVQQDQILDASKYEYWNGTSWTASDPAAAKPVLPGKTTGWFIKRTTYPTVSEMSVQYNPYLQKYVMLYGDSGNNMVMRTATSPEGTWSAPTTLVPAWKVRSLYAPYIHPWSGTENVPASEQQYLYWNMSTYNDYQVRFMRTDLSKIKV